MIVLLVGAVGTQFIGWESLLTSCPVILEARLVDIASNCYFWLSTRPRFWGQGVPEVWM